MGGVLSRQEHEKAADEQRQDQTRRDGPSSLRAADEGDRTGWSVRLAAAVAMDRSAGYLQLALALGTALQVALQAFRGAATSHRPASQLGALRVAVDALFGGSPETLGEEAVGLDPLSALVAAREVLFQGSARIGSQATGRVRCQQPPCLGVVHLSISCNAGLGRSASRIRTSRARWMQRNIWTLSVPSRLFSM